MSQVKKSNKNSLIMQGSILAIASIIVRLIGFVYRIPLVRIIGDTGMGYYGASFEIYAYLLIISSYGLPGAISKIVSAEIARKRYKEAHNIFRSALLFGVVIGIASALLLWFGSKEISNIIKSPNSFYAIRALAPAILLFSVMAVFRGYFQGMNTMVPTAISQIFEQILNAVFSIVLAYVLVKKGIEYGASGGTMGTGIGALFGLIILLLIYLMAKKLINKNIRKDKHIYKKTKVFSYWKLILLTAIPMVIGTAAYQAASIVDLVMFQNALYYRGYTVEATTAMYGVLSGKYRIITTLPISIASALAVASIPSITTSVVKKDIEDVKRKIEMALKTILLISLPSCFGVYVLAKPITRTLFGTANLGITTVMLKIGSISIVLFALTTITIGILQGLGHFKTPVISSAIALVIKIVLNFILLYIFDTNLYGAVVTNIVFALVTVIINLRSIDKHVKIRLNVKQTIIIPTIASFIMGIISLIIYMVTNSLLSNNTVATLTAILIAVIVYFIALFKLGGLSKKELQGLPKGEKIALVLEKLRIV